MRPTAKDNLLRAIHRQQPWWVPDGMEATVWVFPPVIERPATAGVDAFGVRWDYDASAEGGTYPAAQGQVITDLSRWRDQLTLPDPAAADWSAVAAQSAAIDRQKNLVCGFVEMGLFERSWLLLGMEQAMISYACEQEAMTDLLDALADYKIRVIERFHAEARLDMVWYGDDWGAQTNTFLAPAAWRRMVKPATRRIYQTMKRLGILINQHSCGYIEPLIGDLVDMGADCWNPCQPCNDLAALKQRYGHQLTFIGGIDSQFVLDAPTTSPTLVREEVRRRIEQLAPGGGYIAAPSHTVPHRPDLLAAMTEEIADSGRRIYAAARAGLG